ncbi:MAG: putative acyl-CoA dehydrogenase [Herbaspirillum sp.]|nr:putative acyl-CoA dehydrogenase [Herbaspirillum sp.]
MDQPSERPTPPRPHSDDFVTHTVTNQPTPLTPYDAFATDLPLRQALNREGAAWATPEVAAFGPIAGGEMMALGILANENKPTFHPYDRYGHRIDEVQFHPAYHRLMTLGTQHGVSNFNWRHADRNGANVARAALFYLHCQADQGTCCPLTMTYASVASLKLSPALAQTWLPRITSDAYDGSAIPAWQKAGNTIGMGMTEKQGGSDVRANTTRAYPSGASGPDQPYELFGHKWFMSAPMCDAFLILARTDAGISCFLTPKFAPGGEPNGSNPRNPIRIQRLKDKLGDHSNASAEVELQGAIGWMLGEDGRGINTILEMVALTRQDCALGSAALMRQALVQAIHHTRARQAFGKHLVQQPLMQNVLADLALESEAAIVLSMRLARAIDASGRDPGEAAFARLATAIGKYWICKRCAPFVNEAQECLGGAGYVEDSTLPRLYRQAPLNSIWEGSGNIQCLDVLRCLAREPLSRDAFFNEFKEVHGHYPALDDALKDIVAALADSANLEMRSRAIVERMALALQAALLIKAGDAQVADAFCRSRLAGAHGLAFGTLTQETPLAYLIDRAYA